MTGAVIKGNALVWFLRLLGLLPIDWVSAIGYRVGTIVGPRNGVRDARVRHNLSILRPELAAPDVIEKSVRDVWGNMGRSMMEFAVLDRLMRSNRTTVIGGEHLAAARQSGRPRLGLFVHLGNWEVIGPAISGVDEDWRQISQPLVNVYRNKIALNGRRRHASRYIVPGNAAGNQILGHLRDNGFLAIAGDEYVRGELLAPSFGQPVRLDGNLGRVVRLAKVTDALICPYFGVRTKGARFELTVQPAIDLDVSGEDYLERGVARLDAAISAIIVAHLDQWLMLDNFKLPSVSAGFAADR